jgi:hypothetical protein
LRSCLASASGIRYFNISAPTPPTSGPGIAWTGPIATGNGGEISSDLHNATAVKVAQVLARGFPHPRFSPEMNPRNGSVKFLGSLPGLLSVAQAEG